MRQGRQWLGRTGWVVSLACGTCGTPAADAPPDEFDLPPPPSPWFSEFNFRTAAGYNDNVSLASASPTDSGFLSTGAEWFASRLPIDHTGVDAFVLFDDIRYFRSEPVDQEQLGFAQATVKQDVTDRWQMSLGIEYLYQDQILDVSTETDLNTVRVQGHSVGGRPGLRLQLDPRVFLSVDWGIQRQFFKDPLDSYWESGPRVTFGLNYGHRSQFTASYESQLREYDHFQLADEDGGPIPGTQRVFREYEIKLMLRHYYDAKRRWRSTFKFGYKNNQDTGAGYYDYDRYSGAHQFAYRAAGWDATAELGYSYYSYPVQRTGGPDSPKRRRGEVRVDARIEKELKKFLKIFAHYEYENVNSNESLFDYTVNEVTSGVIWIF